MEWAELPFGRQTLHHDWLLRYRGLQASLFVLSLGIELTHFLHPKTANGYPNWKNNSRKARRFRLLLMIGCVGKVRCSGGDDRPLLPFRAAKGADTVLAPRLPCRSH
jgi:hypothetical protein